MDYVAIFLQFSTYQAKRIIWNGPNTLDTMNKCTSEKIGTMSRNFFLFCRQFFYLYSKKWALFLVLQSKIRFTLNTLSNQLSNLNSRHQTEFIGKYDWIAQWTKKKNTNGIKNGKSTQMMINYCGYFTMNRLILLQIPIKLLYREKCCCVFFQMFYIFFPSNHENNLVAYFANGKCILLDISAE